MSKVLADHLQYAEDDAHVSGDQGTVALAVRKDTPAALAGADGDYAPVEVDNVGRLHTMHPLLDTVAVGELAGSATALQMPTVSCKMVKFKAAYDNAGRVYIGGSGVTVKDGTTDTTTGLELSAGEETGWLPVSNLDKFYRISNNAGDDLTYLALA